MNEAELIDRINSLQAQNIALTQALAALLAHLPPELQAQIQTQYDYRCATLQTVLNNGKTDLDALEIQREIFAKTRSRVFG